MALSNKIDHEAVRQTQGLFEKELKFPNMLTWGEFTVKHPHNIIVTLYDFEKEKTIIRFLNRDRALIFTGKKRGLSFKGSIDKRNLILLNDDYEIGFRNLLESIYRVEVNGYKYDINVGSIDLTNIIFSDTHALIEYGNIGLDERINTFIDLSYVQDMFMSVMVMLWTVLPDVLQEVKTHLQIDYKGPTDFLEQLKQINDSKV